MESVINLFSFDGREFSQSLGIFMCIISFLIYWSLYTSSHGNGIKVIKARFIGFAVMAVLPVGILLVFTGRTLKDLGLSYVPGTLRFMVVSSLVFAAAGVLVTVLNPGAPKHFEKYPQIRDSRWPGRIYFLNILSWVIYLTGYEVMFRGVVLFTVMSESGIWPAIAVSTALYSAFHVQKGMFEAFGALFLGLIFSILTFISGSIWTALIIHVSMGVSNTIWSFNRNPGMEPAEISH